MGWPDLGASCVRPHPLHTQVKSAQRECRAALSPGCWGGGLGGAPWGAVHTWARRCCSEVSRRCSRKPRSPASVSARPCRSRAAAGTSPFLSLSRPCRAWAASDGGVGSRIFCRRVPASSWRPVRDLGRKSQGRAGAGARLSCSGKPATALPALRCLGEPQADGGLSPGRRSLEQRDIVAPCWSHGLACYQYSHLGWSRESVTPWPGSTV